METITNAASTAATTASKLIWGEGNTTQGNETAGQEPISGEQGKGTVNDPYDQGNSANPTSTTNDSTLSSNPTTSSTMSETTSNIPPNPTSAAAGGEINPQQETDKTGVVAGRTGDAPKAIDINPSSSDPNPGVAPESGGVEKQKQQGGDRPLEQPTEEKKDEAEDFMKTRDPNDHSGEPMKMHDGNQIPATQEERRESKAGMPGGQPHGEEPKGTGEQHVKATGMHADGGDFDATKPGAGREADRLMEEKGIKRDGDNHGAPITSEEPSSSGKEQKEKVPLGEKIKNKLHIGSKDK